MTAAGINWDEEFDHHYPEADDDFDRPMPVVAEDAFLEQQYEDRFTVDGDW